MNSFVKPLAGLICGSIFGIGLSLSQMVNPKKVLGFLDVFGNWDPSLAFVMGGALIVTAIAYRFINKLSAPKLLPTFDLPKKTKIDKSLISGAVMFGIGWGMVGLCPGPALANLAIGVTNNSFEAVIFVASMVAGVLLHGLIKK